MRLNLAPAVLLLFAVLPAIAQVPPGAQEGSLPLAVGAGFSNYYTEMFQKRMDGATVWADWTFQHVPARLRGIGLEAEVRDLDFGQPHGFPMRQFTAGGGPIYTWRHFRNLHPYAKFLVDYGSMNHLQDFGFPAWYKSDKWAIYAVGGGGEYRVWRNVWVRADYEYQFWKVEFYNPNSYLDPNGITIGASYHFGRIRTR
jgi:hypothetical protein